MVITDTLNRDGRLFVSYVQPHKPVSGDTIKRWVKQVLTNAGIDTSTFTAHSTRSASTSVAANAGLPLQDILQAAGWSSESTFYKFYRRHISVTAEGDCSSASPSARFASAVLSMSHD